MVSPKNDPEHHRFLLCLMVTLIHIASIREGTASVDKKEANGQFSLRDPWAEDEEEGEEGCRTRKG
ncbi:hypothetical protein BJY00DRAFT_277491 [Aspergillus carlsbadensis]|nr:hypothetical protein BJY00DRAFT_277491 [Aspergillus carlsbadensis]